MSPPVRIARAARPGPSTTVHRLGAVAAIVAVAGAALGPLGCVVTDDTGTAAAGSEAACADLLVQERCFDCLETACCEELRACIADDDAGGCAACIAGDGDACAGAEAAVALYVCLLRDCSGVCSEDAPGPACDAPANPPSAGSCASLGDEVACNPVTNEGCDGAAGEACDYDGGRFQCYAPPNEAALCAPCGGEDGFCAPGLTCFRSVAVKPDGVAIRGACARPCCDDADCGQAGACSEMVEAGGARVGVCLERGAEQ